MLTRRPIALFVLPLAGFLVSLTGSAQGLDNLLQFANAGKVPTPLPVSTVNDGVRVPVGTTSISGTVALPATDTSVQAGVPTEIYRDCENEILLVPAGNDVAAVRKESCDYERVGTFPWGQAAATPVELNVPLAASTLGALQVVVEQNGQPVPDARVTISRDAVVITDRGAGALGTTTFPLEPGDYTATITGGGRTTRGDITVDADALSSVTAQTDRGRLVENDTPVGQYRPIPTTRADRGYAVSAADLNGLLSVRIDSPLGVTFLAFPANAAAGDTVSWSALTAPSGTTKEDINERGGQLRSQIVTINNEEFALADATRWTMASIPNLSIGVGGDDPKVEFRLRLPMVPSRPLMRLGDDPIPARAGWPVHIPGTFDGRFDTTTISLAGTGLDVVAESPTAVYFNPPLGDLGVQQVGIVEQGESRQVAIRNIGLDLSVDQDDLWRGQSTPLHVKATGLAGITTPAFLYLINRTTSVISMSQGNSQFWLIHPRDVANGEASYDRAVQGIKRGPFSVDGILVVY